MSLDKIFLIVDFGNDDVAAYHLIDLPFTGGQKRPDASYHYAAAEPVEKSWRRHKVKDRTSFGKVLTKHYPNAVAVPFDAKNERLETNRLLDQGEVYAMELREYEGKVYPSMHPASRLDEHGEMINADGIPIRDINCITGEPYPLPGPGQQRYVVTIIYGNGASYCDVHQMRMAANPRDAVLMAFDELEKRNEDADALFLAVFKFDRSTVRQSFAADHDSQETFFFNGPDVLADAAANEMTSMFNMMARAFQ